MSDGTNSGDGLSRRKMLALTMSGAAAGVAGCNQGGTGDGTTTGGTDTTTATSTGTGTTAADTETEATTEETTQSELSPEEMADSTPATAIDFIPQDANWNVYSPGPLDGNLVYQALSSHYWNNTSDWFLLEEEGYSYDSDSRTATYNFKEGYSWWNGDPVTAEDYHMQRELNRLFDPEGSPWEEWTIADDYTVEGTRETKINPVLLGQGGGSVNLYRDKFRQWLEQFRDATSQSERDSIYQELTNWQISTETFANEGLGNTVYRLADWGTTEFVFERFDEHPLADQCAFPEIRHRVAQGSSLNQAINNDELDYKFGAFPGNLRQSAPDHLQTIFRKRTISCRNLLFNYKNNKHIGRRNVRRALVTVLDWNTLRNYWQGEGGFVKQTQTGIPQVLQNRWLGDEIMSQMYEYPLESDPEQANQFMEDAGYTKEGNTWIGPDGDPLEFSMLIGTFGTLEALGKAMTQSWDQWGAEPTLLAQNNSNWVSKTTSGEGWDMSIFKHGFNIANPMNFYDYRSHWHMRLGNNESEVKQWLENGETHSQRNGRPMILEIPSTPGALEVEGEGQQINIVDLVDELQVTQSEERTREIVRTLARYFNYDLPMFDMFPQTAGMWGDTRDFDWPDEANVYFTPSTTADDLVWQTGAVDPVPADDV